MHTRHAHCPCVHAPRIVVVGTAINIALVALVLSLVFGFSPFTGWLRVGWHDELSVAGVPIDTPAAYAVIMSLTVGMNVLALWLEDAVKPLITFPIYNFECTQIDMYSRGSLWFLANTYFICESLRRLFDVLLYTAQLDLALAAALSGEFVSIFVVRWLLGKKEFRPYGSAPSIGARAPRALLPTHTASAHYDVFTAL